MKMFKNMSCRNEFKSAGNFAGYLLRSGETGLSCCTGIMDDSVFLQQLDQLYVQQKTDFYKEFSLNTIKFWESRDFERERADESAKVAADPTYKAKNLDRAEKKRDSILRKHEAFCSKPWHVRGGSERAQSVTDIAHKISVTQIVDQTKGRIGHQIQRTLPNNSTKEQIIQVLKAMRDAVPVGHPAIFTVHKDDRKHNLHIQAWVSSKSWDSKASSWHERPVGNNGQREFAYFETAAGLHAYRSTVEKAMTDAGLKFPHAADTSLPRVTGSHPFVQVLLKNHSKTDFISGKVKDGVRSEHVRAICDQIGARAKAIMDKQARIRNVLNASKKFHNTLAITDEIKSLFNPTKSFVAKMSNQIVASLAPSDNQASSPAFIPNIKSTKSATASASNTFAAMPSRSFSPSSKMRI